MEAADFPPKSGLHGFRTWIDFAKATLSLGGMLTLGLWGILTWGMDRRYAPMVLADQVAANGLSAQAVQVQVKDLQESVVTVQTSLIEGQIFELQVRACTSESSETRRFYAQRIIELSNQYFDLTGHRPSVPECSSLR